MIYTNVWQIYRYHNYKQQMLSDIARTKKRDLDINFAILKCILKCYYILREELIGVKKHESSLKTEAYLD